MAYIEHYCIFENVIKMEYMKISGSWVHPKSQKDNEKKYIFLWKYNIYNLCEFCASTYQFIQILNEFKFKNGVARILV